VSSSIKKIFKKKFIFIISIIIFTIVILNVFSITNIKKGDWIKYDASFSQELKFFNEPNMNNFTDSYKYETLIEILNISNNNITIKQINTKFDDSTYIQDIFTADPNMPYTDPPFNKIHLFFIPPNLDSGDKIPEPSFNINELGDLESIPFLHVINETINKSILGISREINHIQYNQTIVNNVGITTWKEIINEDSYYDKVTGLLIEFSSNSSKITYGNNKIIKAISLEEHYYAITDSSYLRNIILITSLPYVATIIIIIIIIALFRKDVLMYIQNKNK
jgi:hypothetical protein